MSVADRLPVITVLVPVVSPVMTAGSSTDVMDVDRLNESVDKPLLLLCIERLISPPLGA